MSPNDAIVLLINFTSRSKPLCGGKSERFIFLIPKPFQTNIASSISLNGIGLCLDLNFNGPSSISPPIANLLDLLSYRASI